MKKAKQIFAIIGVILLVGMYLSTLIFAFIDRSTSLWLLKSSIAMTIIIPVFLYACILVYRLAHKSDDEDTPEA